MFFRASIPPDLHYNTSLYQETNMTHEADIGPQLVHLYGIRNNGPSTIEEAEVFLLWPYETLAGRQYNQPNFNKHNTIIWIVWRLNSEIIIILV